MVRKDLWSAAKLAVRAYAHDPSQENSLKVAMAWKAIRDDSAAVPHTASPASRAGSKPQHARSVT